MKMRELAQHSTNFLHTAFDTHGWPNPRVIGPDCMEAVWFVSASAVYDAIFQERTIDVVSEALPDGGFWEYHYAALKDRYLTLSKQPTIYGIPFGSYYDDDGKFRLYLTRTVDPANVDKRRAIAGYVPIRRKIVFTIKSHYSIAGRFQILSICVSTSSDSY